MVWKTTYISSKKRIGPKFKFFDHGPHRPSPCAAYVFLHWRSIHHTALQSTKLLYLEKQSMGRKEFRSIKRKHLPMNAYWIRLWMIIEWRLMSTRIRVFLQIDRYNPAFLHGRRETQFDHLIHFICFYSRTKARISTAATDKFLSLLTWNIPTYVHSNFHRKSTIKHIYAVYLGVWMNTKWTNIIYI